MDTIVIGELIRRICCLGKIWVVTVSVHILDYSILLFILSGEDDYCYVSDKVFYYYPHNTCTATKELHMAYSGQETSSFYTCS